MRLLLGSMFVNVVAVVIGVVGDLLITMEREQGFLD